MGDGDGDSGDGDGETSASAFAFHSGDFYFATEGTPAGCAECFEACSPSYAECLADPECAASFERALQAVMIWDDCGGLMPMELIDKFHDENTCLDVCFPIGGP
ncbi:hypothetical protein [Enhygromyxa salina]|uniref:Uncharacterized protein n=1 Tax=Enhygromyxa salina TaxID=215803 RepID=A0A2S9YR40_9BACT|nr:hypothetical protein [Enhygromyxa salina]PRQ07565.1 hypothetical protein ENSA7_25550 [Enhygromyxa salina]